MLEISVLDFSPVGSLQFYALQSQEHFDKGFPLAFMNNIYWRDAKAPKGFGPFNNMYDALQHYKYVIRARPVPSEQLTMEHLIQEPSNIMYVDFVNKKVIK